ncbi:hypothetical protein D6C98_06509 [Aureobasidium pullulans]|nr:hypothetical protein D6C98_06509 [Aureobasidium pullulans]
MDSEIEIYCAICGPGFIRVVDLEFHQSAHDVKFMTSGMNSLAQLTDEHEREYGTKKSEIKMFKAPKQTNQMTAPIQTPHGSPTSAATEYEDTAIMPTSKAEAMTPSPTSGPSRVLKMKHKFKVHNVHSTKEDSNSAKRGRKDPAGLPRDDDRLFVTPDQEDPHKQHYFHREDIESTNPAGQDDRINDNILETDPGADEEPPKADD